MPPTLLSLTCLALFLASLPPASAQQYDGSRLSPYTGTWRQLSDRPEGRVRTGCIREALLPVIDGNWIHIQVGEQPGRGFRLLETRWIDGGTMRTTRIHRAVQNGPDAAPLMVDLVIAEDQASGFAILRDGSRQEIVHEYGGPVRDGWVLGLVAATLPLAEEFEATDRVAIPALGQEHLVRFEVTGREFYPPTDSDAVEVWAVDTHWVNLEDGDIYGGGRDNPGGTYYIRVDPQPGHPAVIGYRNENVTIERGSC